MEAVRGSAGNAGVVEVIVHSIFKTAHKDVLWPVHTTGQVTELLHIFSHWPVVLPQSSNTFLGFVVRQYVLESEMENHHEVVKGSELWGIGIMEGHHMPRSCPF